MISGYHWGLGEEGLLLPYLQAVFLCRKWWEGVFPCGMLFHVEYSVHMKRQNWGNELRVMLDVFISEQWFSELIWVLCFFRSHCLQLLCSYKELELGPGNENPVLQKYECVIYPWSIQVNRRGGKRSVSENAVVLHLIPQQKRKESCSQTSRGSSCLMHKIQLCLKFRNNIGVGRLNGDKKYFNNFDLPLNLLYLKKFWLCCKSYIAPFSVYLDGTQLQDDLCSRICGDIVQEVEKASKWCGLKWHALTSVCLASDFLNVTYEGNGYLI